ncbi:hypothetical protein RhiJN_21505 [Ceratobasidium sp. AG-Ba]|nr:hypothetical protein RhiJN_21505 [Ceratobasidium sp. AG-Ba]
MAYPHFWSSASNPYAKVVNRFAETHLPYYTSSTPYATPGGYPSYHPAPRGPVPYAIPGGIPLPPPPPPPPAFIPDPDAWNVARLIGSRTEEWERYIHPNGSSYWTYLWSNGTFVVSDVEPPSFASNPVILGEIQAASKDLASNSSFSTSLDIHITGNGCAFIHHDLRSGISAQKNMVKFQAQLSNLQNLGLFERLQLEARYWAYIESHPNHRTLFPFVLDEVSAALTWCYADRVLYEASNSPFEKENAREMLDLIQNMGGIDQPGSPAAVLRTWYCAAVMRAIVYDRRHSHYGRRRAAEIRRRAQSDDLAIDLPYNSMIERVLWYIAGVLAFGSPFGYLKRIHNVDRTVIGDGINTIRWRALLKELCKEWTDSNLLATVLVAGTVALLAIPNINGMTQLAGLLSALCALASVLAGTLLVGNHQSRVESSSEAAFIYFKRAKLHGLGTTRPLAVILSLPVSLMLWGMFWFIFAIGSNAYASGLSGISAKYSLATRVLILSLVLAFLIVGILVVLFLYNVWVSPTVVPIVAQTPQKPDPVSTPTQPTKPTSIHVHTPDPGHNILPTNTSDILPDYRTNMQTTSLYAPPVVSRPRSSSTITSDSDPPQARRPTVEFESDPSIIPSPLTPTTRSQSLDTAYSPYGMTPLAPSTRSQSIGSSVLPSQPNRAAGVVPGMPLLNAMPYPITPSRGFFVDIDVSQVAPYATTTEPEFHVFQRGAQVTLIASTGQVALLLTTQNEAIWSFLLEDDSRYVALVEDIRSTCEQYGKVESINVPRQAAYQIRPESIGQACIKFALPEGASRALRGFLDRPLEHCPVSARLLNEDEEVAWGFSRPAIKPSLSTVIEEGSLAYDAAVSARVESPENVVETDTIENTAGEPIHGSHSYL